MSSKWPWEKVYVLNLDKDKDKWNIMKKQLKSLNIKGDRFSAVYGLDKFPFGDKIKKVKEENKKWQLIEKMNEKLKKEGHVHRDVGNNEKSKFPYMRPGELGHLASFLKIFQDIVTRGYEQVLILEDDCLFTEGFKKKFFESYNNLPENWNLFYLGVNQIHLDSTPKPENVNSKICRLKPIIPKNPKKKYKYGAIYGTHAMLIKRKTAKEWLHFAYPFRYPSDIVMGKIINKYNRINAYYPCYQLVEATSDIDNSSTRLI